MSFSKECCNTPPTAEIYKPLGKVEKIDDLEVYVTGVNNTKTVIGIYDIFGFNVNTFHFLDLLAAKGYRVIVPDIFKGNPWDYNDYPFKSIDKLKEWISAYTFKGHVKPILDLVFNHYKLGSEAKVGAIGFCWGGKVISEEAKLSKPLFSAGVMLHPSLLTVEEFKEYKIPISILATKSEEELLGGFKDLSSEVAASSQIHDFTDTFHGFAAARADFDDATNRKRIDDALVIITEFLSKHIH